MDNRQKTHLLTTLWALYLIAYLTQRYDIAAAVKRDMEAA